MKCRNGGVPQGRYMNPVGNGIYLPLEKGRNEVVLAVTDFTGGWEFWARLDP